ncbi:MAG: cytochrome c biogenesis protein CcsA [Polyangiaceae bacterium]|nr:cytochrome c biogenesis protein CcsA [Polyangiaceae bacterium]
MIEALTTGSFVVAAIAYAAATALFFLDIVRAPSRAFEKKDPAPTPANARLITAPRLLGFAAIAHATHVTMASFVAKVCPVHSVHFLLSIASLLAVAIYLPARRRFRIESLGLLVAPLGLAFIMGTFLLGRPEPEPRASPLFIALHVLSNLLGVALFMLAGGAAVLYLVQDNRLKMKRMPMTRSLGALETLDLAVHRFLIAAFPLVTLGIVTGTYWARKLETGSPDEVMRAIFGYATWFLIAGVLLLRAAAGLRGRRAAYGTILGLGCALAVLVIYMVRPNSPPSTSASGESGRVDAAGVVREGTDT